MALLLVNIIGAGKLGKTLGRLLVQHDAATLVGICNKNIPSTREAIAFIGAGQCISDLAVLPAANITFITAPDDCITDLSIKLAQCDVIRPHSIVVHCSGVLTSDALSALKSKHALLASIHPMRSFSHPSLAIEQYSGTFCAMEGDTAALRLLEPLLQSIGSVTYTIKKEKKSLYHAAGVFASNYVVTLAHEATKCLLEAGIDQNHAKNILLSLMHNTLSNIKNASSLHHALTGPIQRGDIETIKTHLATFASEQQKQLYTTLGEATLDITSHNNTNIRLLKQVLNLSR